VNETERFIGWVNTKRNTAMSNDAMEQDSLTPEQREDQIRLAAYFIWQANGEPEGTAEEDWLRAEEALAEESVEAV